ncbi:hypothetical protein H4R34_004456, partial [Dimargaris verticillata]
MATATEASPTTSPTLPTECSASDPSSSTSESTLSPSPDPPVFDAAAALRREKNRLLIRRFIAIGCTQDALLQKGLDPDLVRECFVECTAKDTELATASPEPPKALFTLSETEDGELSSHSGTGLLRQRESGLAVPSEAEDGQLESQSITMDRDAVVAMDISSDSDHSRSPPTDIPLSRLSEPLVPPSTRPMPYEPPFQYFQLAHGAYPYATSYNSLVSPFGNLTVPFVRPYNSYWAASGNTGNDISYGDRDTSYAFNGAATDPGTLFTETTLSRSASSAGIVTKTSAVLRSALHANATSRPTLRKTKSVRQALALARTARLAAHTSFVRNSMECAYISESDNDDVESLDTPSGRAHPMNRLCLEQQPSAFGSRNVMRSGPGSMTNGSNGSAATLGMDPQSRELLKEHEAKIAEFKAMIRRMEAKRGGESPLSGQSASQASVSPVSAPEPLMESAKEPTAISLSANVASQQQPRDAATSTSGPNLGSPAQPMGQSTTVANEAPASLSNVAIDEPMAIDLGDSTEPLLKVYNEPTTALSKPSAPAKPSSPKELVDDALVSAESLAQLESELAQQEDRARDSFQREKEQLAVVRELQSLLDDAKALLSDFSTAHHKADTKAQSLRQQIQRQRKVLLRRMAKPSATDVSFSPALGVTDHRSALISKLKRKMDSLKQEHDTLRSTKQLRTEPPPEATPTPVKPISTAAPRFVAYLMQWAKQHPFDRYAEQSDTSSPSAKYVAPKEPQPTTAVASSLPSTIRPFLILDQFYEYDLNNWLWPNDVIDLPSLRRQSEAATPSDTRFKTPPSRTEIAKALRDLNPIMATGDVGSTDTQTPTDSRVDLGLTSAGSVLRHFRALTCVPISPPLWLALLDLVLWAWQRLPPIEPTTASDGPSQGPLPVYRAYQGLFQTALEQFPYDTRIWWRFMGWQSDPQRRDHHLCQIIYHFAMITPDACKKQTVHASNTVTQAALVLLQLRLSSTDAPNTILRWMYQLLTAPNLERFLAVVQTRPDQIAGFKRPMVAVPASVGWIKTLWGGGRIAYLWLGYLHARAFGALSLHMFFDSAIGYFVPNSQQLFYIDWTQALQEPWDASVLTVDAWDEMEELLQVLSATFSHMNTPTYAAVVYNYVGLMQARAYPVAGIVANLKTIKHGESPKIPETQELLVRLEATGFAQGQALDEVYFQRVIVHFPHRLGLWNRLAKLVWRRFHDKVRLAELLSRAINVLYANRDPIKNEWKFLESTLVLHLGSMSKQTLSTVVPNIPERLRRKVFALDRTGDQPLDVTATELAARQAQAPVIDKDVAALRHSPGNTKQLLACHMCILLIIAGEDIGQFVNPDYFFPCPFVRYLTSSSSKASYAHFRQFVWTCCMTRIRHLASNELVSPDDVVRQANQLVTKVLVPPQPLLSYDQISQLPSSALLAPFAVQPGLVSNLKISQASRYYYEATISNTQHEQYLTYHLLPPGLRFAVLKTLAATHPHDLGFGLTVVRYLQDARLSRDALLWLGTLLQRFPHLPWIKR